MKDYHSQPNQMHKQAIDRMIDWRKANRPDDKKPIEVLIEPKDLHVALGLFFPANLQPEQFPAHCLYRGYRIVSKPAMRRAEGHAPKLTLPGNPSSHCGAEASPPSGRPGESQE